MGSKAIGTAQSGQIDEQKEGVIFMLSWDDQLHSASTNAEKAKVHLRRAQQRASKRLMHTDIEAALALLGEEPYAAALLDRYGLPYSANGLAEAAERLLAEIGS